MTRLSDLDQRQHLADPASKQGYVTLMFDEIAPRYAQFTRWFSYGMDERWKQELIQGVAAALPAGESPQRALDVACGTGDLACALADAHPGLRVTGVDLSPVMISCARSHAGVDYRIGDGMRLAEADGSVQVITIGYGLRNFPDHRRALHEMARLLAPHGVLGIMEFTRPAWAPWRWLLLGYLSVAGWIYGWWWHRHGPVYGYIARSIAAFTSRAGLETDLADAGFVLASRRVHLGGGMVVLVARRQP